MAISNMRLADAAGHTATPHILARVFRGGVKHIGTLCIAALLRCCIVGNVTFQKDYLGTAQSWRLRLPSHVVQKASAETYFNRRRPSPDDVKIHDQRVRALSRSDASISPRPNSHFTAQRQRYGSVFVVCVCA
jgi:hypothetical protein